MGENQVKVSTAPWTQPRQSPKTSPCCDQAQQPRRGLQQIRPDNPGDLLHAQRRPRPQGLQMLPPNNLAPLSQVEKLRHPKHITVLPKPGRSSLLQPQFCTFSFITFQISPDTPTAFAKVNFKYSLRSEVKMRRGRTGRPVGLYLPQRRDGFPPILSLSPPPPPPRTLPPQPEGGGKAARPGTRGRAPGSRGWEGGGGIGPLPRPPRGAAGRPRGAGAGNFWPRRADPGAPRPHPGARRVGGRGFPFFASQRLRRDPRGGGGRHSPYYRWRRCFGQSLV